MGRWPAGGQERLHLAAIELFADQGYDRTTVAEIAAAAGLTERTFYNHFTDKREALFPAQDRYLAAIVDTIASAPAERGALDVVVAALAEGSEWFDERLDAARRRRRTIDAHRELRERELTKLADLTAAIAGAMVDRGAPDAAASLTAAAAVAAHQLATVAWLADVRERPLAMHLHEAVAALRSTAGSW